MSETEELLEKSPVAKRRGNPNFGKRKEKPEAAEEIDLEFEIDPAKTYLFETLTKSDGIQYKNLGSQAKAFDPDQKRFIYLRYFPTVNSIFQDEQDESWDEEQLPPLMFSRGEISVQGQNRRLMEYMMFHPLREGSPYALQSTPPFFRLLDKDIEERIKQKRNQQEFTALQLLEKTSIDDLRPIARVIFGITDTSDVAIMNKLHDMAKRPKNPRENKSGAEQIIENIDNQKLMRTYYIQRAFDLGLIIADFQTMQVKWVEGNIFINHMKAIKYVNELTDWSFTSDGGKFYTELKRKLS